MKKYAENDFATYRLEKGILHIVFKEGVSLSVKDAMEVGAERLIVQEGMAFPILCNIVGLKDVTWDAQRYFAVEGSALIKALALVSNTPLSIAFAKLYLREAPPIQVKVFREERMALEFLAPFVQSSSDWE